MFTGIVEAIGKVVRADLPHLEIEIPSMWKKVHIGESIAVNGVCLTVIKQRANCLTFDVAEETERRTTMSELNKDERVNLERALQQTGRLGGHFVTGHIDGVGRIFRRNKQRTQEILEIETPDGVVSFMAPKGSVTVDGVSLTLGPVGNKSFTVFLVPHTLQNTTLGKKQVGDKVNVETDVLAKYVVQYLKNNR